MTDSCIASEYFSGQGSLLIGSKDPATGLPTGLVAVGNVSALTLGIETTVFDHKESCSGTRGIDKQITQEIAVSVAFSMESFSKENLALGMYGTAVEKVGAAVSDETIKIYKGKWVSLLNPKVSGVVIGNDATPTTTYILGTDYELNAETGSFRVLTGSAIVEGATLFVDYTFATHEIINAITSSAAPERWIRFEGLNTADTNKPVIIDIYKMSVQPLAELSVINEELAEMEINGAALLDTTRTTGSKYFNVKKIK